MSTTELLVSAAAVEIDDALCLMVSDGYPVLTVTGLGVDDKDRRVYSKPDIQAVFGEINTHEYRNRGIAFQVEVIQGSVEVRYRFASDRRTIVIERNPCNHDCCLRRLTKWNSAASEASPLQ